MYAVETIPTNPLTGKREARPDGRVAVTNGSTTNYVLPENAEFLASILNEWDAAAAELRHGHEARYGKITPRLGGPSTESEKRYIQDMNALTGKYEGLIRGILDA